jgi:cell wall-associated NlpC family hydrolase
MTADDIIAAARSALGVPFRHQGRSVETGLDCAGLVCHVAKTLGIAHNDRTDYARTPGRGEIERMLNEERSIMTVLNRAPGDILLMRFSRNPAHLAIFTGDNIIHSYETVGRVVEHRLDSAWASRIVSAYRFVGVA